MKPKNFPGRREQRHKEALERDAYRATLTLEQKVALCESRPGESRRELKRLMNPKVVAAAVAETVVEEARAKKRAPDRRDKKALKALKRKEGADKD